MKFKEVLVSVLLEAYEMPFKKGIVKYRHLTQANNQILHFAANNIVSNPHRETIDYTLDSTDINRDLWKHKKNMFIPVQRLSTVNTINRNLDENKPLSDDLIVYSGVRRDPQELVKDSGGLLHHPAFLSTSINPRTALNFSETSNGAIHLLKIKLRKGQRVGSYIGEKSTHSTENEYLIKANNMLHITPEYDIHIGKNGEPIKIHHAIVLEPHEYEHLIDNKEVQSKKDLDAKLSIHKDEINRKIDKDIENNRVDDNYLQQHMLEPQHIDKIIDNTKLHNSLAQYQILEPHHIDKMIEDKVINPEHLASQTKLSDRHISYLLSLNNKRINSALLSNNNIELPNKKIDDIIDTQTYHTLSNNANLSSNHIHKIIDRQDNNVSVVASRGDLDKTHIDKLINLQDSDINTIISNNNNLTSEHIDKILDSRPLSSYTLRYLSQRPNLNDNHVSKILSSNLADKHILYNILDNYNINNDHKKIIKNNESFSDDEKKLVE